MKNLLSATIFFVFLGCSSSKGPYKETNKAYNKQVKEFSKAILQQPLEEANDTIKAPTNWAGTTNFGMRKPNFVIIHHTAQNSCDQTLATFTMTKTQVSAHYVICRDGTVHHMLNDYLRAWHAGNSKWGRDIDINSASIGIEIDNNGFEPFSDAQINSLLSVLAKLKKNFSIPVANFIGHSDIAPGRKVDPSKYFPWQKLSQQGFGLWYDTANIQLPIGFDSLQALRIIGYDIKNPASAIGSFKLHYDNLDTTKTITEGEKKMLYDLMRKS